MRLAIGSDHRGVRYRGIIKDLLERMGHVVQDFGADAPGSVDYPDYAFPVAQSVARGESDRGVLICATGIGMSMAANRVKGVRAALCLNEWMARMARLHNDSNVLCLGQDVIDEPTMRAVVRTWLSTEFEGGRHCRRLQKIDSMSESPEGCP